jgi:hypothetical protein
MSSAAASSNGMASGIFQQLPAGPTAFSAMPLRTGTHEHAIADARGSRPRRPHRRRRQPRRRGERARRLDLVQILDDQQIRKIDAAGAHRDAHLAGRPRAPRCPRAPAFRGRRVAAEQRFMHEMALLVWQRPVSRSCSSRHMILPAPDLGSASTNSMIRGTLYAAMFSRHQSMIACAFDSSRHSGRSTTTALTVSPRCASRRRSRRPPESPGADTSATRPRSARP